jgi:hypothetical protein
VINVNLANATIKKQMENVSLVPNQAAKKILGNVWLVNVLIYAYAPVVLQIISVTASMEIVNL